MLVRTHDYYVFYINCISHGVLSSVVPENPKNSFKTKTMSLFHTNVCTHYSG